MAQTLSVVTVVLNDVKNIQKTVNSVIKLKKKFSIKYIVIDGGSTDGTIEKLSHYSNSIDIIFSEKDSGIYDAMNKSINYVDDNDFILWLNSGDILLNCDFLNTNLIYKFDVVLASTKRLNSKNRKSIIFKSYYYGLTNKDYLKNKLHHQAFIIRKNFFNDLNFDSERFGMVADLFFMLRNCDQALQHNKLLILNDVITCYMPDGVSDIPNIGRIFSHLKVMNAFDLSVPKIFIHNPYKFFRMILKSLVPHSIGKLLT